MSLVAIFVACFLISILAFFIPRAVVLVRQEFLFTLLGTAAILVLYKRIDWLAARLKAGSYAGSEASKLLFPHVKWLRVERDGIFYKSGGKIVAVRGVRVVDVPATFRELQPEELYSVLMRFGQLADPEARIYVVQKKVPIKREALIPAAMAIHDDLKLMRMRKEMFADMLEELGTASSLETVFLAVAHGRNDQEAVERASRAMRMVKSRLLDVQARYIDLAGQALIEFASFFPCSGRSS